MNARRKYGICLSTSHEPRQKQKPTTSTKNHQFIEKKVAVVFIFPFLVVRFNFPPGIWKLGSMSYIWQSPFRFQVLILWTYILNLEYLASESTLYGSDHIPVLSTN